MTRNLTTARRLREVLLDGRWIANTNYKEQILTINWKQAVEILHGLNSIAALTYHINYYLEGLLYAFENNKLTISDKYSFDVPEIHSEADWTNLVNKFLNNSEKFANRVEQMNDDLFDTTFMDEKYGSYLRNIEGVIEHSYCHLGQISLICKLIDSNQSYLLS